MSDNKGKGLLQQIEEGVPIKGKLTAETMENFLKDLTYAGKNNDKPLIMMFNCKTNGATITTEDWMPCRNKECGFCSAVIKGFKEEIKEEIKIIENENTNG